MRRFLAYGPAIVVLMTALAVLAVAPNAIRAVNSAETRAQILLAQQSLDGDDILERLNQATRNIAMAVEPAVVHIRVFGTDAARGQFRGSMGSGWVFDDRGHIITNAHVVEGARAVRVEFADGRMSEAEVVATDPPTDVAVLRVETGSHLHPLRRATGEQPFKGDRVFAFGSPFGFKFSITEGIVSGLGRSASSAFGIPGISNYIQHDAAVNPGNSGGPLVDIRGRVIGMNVAIATADRNAGGTEGQSAGISFAIPLATIESRVTALINGEPIIPGFLGIEFAPGTSAGDGGRGVRVERVTSDGAAAAAGIQVGDVITEINGQPILNGEVLRAIVSTSRPGEDLLLRVYRDGSLQDITVRLGQMPVELRARQYQPLLMMRFGILLDESVEGPVIRGVLPDSIAAAAGLEAGQRIISVAGTRVDTVAETMGLLVDNGLFSGRSVEIVVAASDGDREGEPRTVLLGR